MGSGTQTAAFSAGGSPNVTQTELYNGTTWTTATGALKTGRQFGQAAGDSAAGLVFGGDTGPGVGNETLASESWDGTSWTATNPMAGVAVTATAGGGTQTQAFSALGAFGFSILSMSICAAIRPAFLTDERVAVKMGICCPLFR